MKKILSFFLLFCLTAIAFAQNGNTILHKLDVQLSPAISYLKVTDSVSGLEPGEELVISLNASLESVSFSKNVKAKKLVSEAPAKDIGMDRDDSDGNAQDLKINKWKIKLKKKSTAFVVHYEGKIFSPLKQSEENYQRGFSESPGIISEKGVYLAGSTYWVPTFDERLVTFRLTTRLPLDWKTVSQGQRTANGVKGSEHIDSWVCDKPQEEVFLIAAPFHEYAHTMANGIEAMAFLRTPDKSLANKYLEVTEQYMDMYQQLAGPYPYSKFALVENFWETGYGMPSFTLLGEKIIRFPFILHSSYPHELLHNWWGNSVYVDFETGNWCEGLTAYQADHLIKEQRGQAEGYRRSTLQKFTNVVNSSNDFPLDEFISRHDAPSEAIGYGKSLMMWHMLRRELGDEDFTKGWMHFYERFKFRVASFDDIRKSFEAVTGRDLSGFFTQWTTRTGAPEIALVSADTSGTSLSVVLEQLQQEPVFNVRVPVVVATTDGLETFVVTMDRKRQEYKFHLKGKARKLVVDPQYDVFRKLDPREVPPAWSKILSSKHSLAVLPSKATAHQNMVYRDFIDRWQKANKGQFVIVSDNELDELPADQICWIFGFDNRFAETVNKSVNDYGSGFSADSVVFDGKPYPKENHSYIITVYNPKNYDNALAFVELGTPDAIDGLIRKLPHYGGYSYLGFEGSEPTNVAKGQWPVLNSPLVKLVDPKAKNLDLTQKREPLATVKPVFSSNRMMDHVRYLASDELKGRGLGTAELDEAAGYIAGKFKKYGLQTMGHHYLQEFTHTFPDKGEVVIKNVVGVIPGTDPKLKDQPVVLAAHYDHLGLGWPDVRSGNEGKIHHGADDNASGVAILLEVAKSMAGNVSPRRTVIFVAFSGEEAGLLGSRYFVKEIKKYYPGGVMAAVNLDTDGSLFDKKLMVINGGSAREWKFVFMGTDYTTGVKSELLTQELDASDQVAFIEQGIPAVQLFTGPTENYHRPSDTWDKIDEQGLVKVASVAKEVMVYLADREEPFAFNGRALGGPMGGPLPTKHPSETRKKQASTGTIPDFSYNGDGVKIGAVRGGSPAKLAGLQEGDIITSMGGKTVGNLMEYSKILKSHQPGDVVEVTFLRDGKEHRATVTLGER